MQHKGRKRILEMTDKTQTRQSRAIKENTRHKHDIKENYIIDSSKARIIRTALDEGGHTHQEVAPAEPELLQVMLSLT